MNIIKVPEIDSLKSIKSYVLLGAAQESDFQTVSILSNQTAEEKDKSCDDAIKESIAEKYEKEIEKIIQNTIATLDQEKKTAEIDKLKNYGLYGAVQEGDVEAVRILLDEGANPNYKPKSSADGIFSECFTEKNSREISKLLIQYGITLSEKELDKIFDNISKDYFKEIVSHIVKHHVMDVWVHQSIFKRLISCGLNLGPAELDIFKILLNHGFPVDDYFLKGDWKAFTPLHLSVKYRKPNLVLTLLKNGADINKKMSNFEGETALMLAVDMSDTSMVKLLLKRGARINDKSNEAVTALHIASDDRHSDSEMIYILLENGADVNISMGQPNWDTPFTLGSWDSKEILVREFAKLKFEGKDVSSSNLQSLRDDYEDNTHFEEVYINCLNELEGMKDCKIFNDLTLYDILKMRGQQKKLVSLAENEAFLAGFFFKWDRRSFKYYAKEIDRIFKKPLDISALKKKIHESGLAKHFSLPPEIMEIIIEYVTEQFYYESDEEQEYNGDDDDDDDNDGNNVYNVNMLGDMDSEEEDDDDDNDDEEDEDDM